MASTSMNEVGAIAVQPQPPAKSEPNDEGMTAKFVKVVDERFLQYDKPLVLACSVGGLTLVLGIIILVLQISTSLFEVTTVGTSVTYPQYYGHMWAQRAWYTKLVQETTETESSTETTVATELCIDHIDMVVPQASCEVNRAGSQGTCDPAVKYSKSMPFYSNVAGQLGIGGMERCWPGDNFMNGNALNTDVEPAVWRTTPNAAWPGPLSYLGLPADAPTVMPTISFCSGVEDQYHASAQVPCDSSCTGLMSKSWTGGTAIRALGSEMLAEVTCPPVNNANGPIPWVTQYKQTVTTTSKIKPSLGDAIGIAFAYSAYIQVFFTAVIVNVMLLGNCLKQTSGDGIDDSQEMAQKVFDMVQGKRPSSD